jgi:plasmid maintenance system antidote protein VapI
LCQPDSVFKYVMGQFVQDRCRIPNLTVKELAQLLGITEVQVIEPLFENRKIMRTVNQIVEIQIARQLATDLGYKVTVLDDDS